MGEHKKTILVTGGAGFIGSHLCSELLKTSRVICVDNLFTGRTENIRHLVRNKDFRFINHNIIEPLYLNSLIIDQVYNLACPASPVHYQKNPVETVKANVIGVSNMLGLARRHRARILQASTSEVYGDPLEHPQPETYRGNVNPIGPRACYDEGKRCAETLFFDYHREHKVDIRVARIFNTYGPRMAQDDGRVISNFILQALNNKNISIYGDGLQSRSFCFVTDLVSALIKFMNQDDFVGPLNLGNEGEFTMLELAQQVIKMTDSKSELTYHPLPQDDPKARRPIISKARKILDWEPTIQLEEGLDHTIKYFRNELEKTKSI